VKLAEVRARVEQARKMVEDQLDIQHIWHELEAKTQMFSDASSFYLFSVFPTHHIALIY
jgi:hypothetical protein